jgi:hypothetical protein
MSNLAVFDLGTRHRRSEIPKVVSRDCQLNQEIHCSEYFRLLNRSKVYEERIQFYQEELADVVVSLQDLRTVTLDILVPTIRQTSTFTGWFHRLGMQRNRLLSDIQRSKTRLASIQQKLVALDAALLIPDGKHTRRYSCCF